MKDVFERQKNKFSVNKFKKTIIGAKVARS